MNSKIEKLGIVLILLAAAAVAPNLFVIAQAGYAPLSELAVKFLIPSIIAIIFLYLFAHVRGFTDLTRQLHNGLLGGLIATVGLEVVRHVGFLMGGMPGEMPKLMGVLLLNRFALGPSFISNLAGWGYHFWNGAAFGIIYSLLIGRGRIWTGILYGLIIGVGFMVSPVVVALGVGRFGVDFGWGFPATVILAHLVFGILLGIYMYKRNENSPDFFKRLKIIFNSGNPVYSSQALKESNSQLR